jgi:hypothetical protein
MSLPPWNVTWEIIQMLLGPALGASLAVMLAVRLVGRERLTPLAAALAVAVGVFAANYFKESVPFQYDNARPLTAHDLYTVLGWSLEKQPPGEEEEPQDLHALLMPPLYYWLLWLAGLALVVEMLARILHVPASAGWVARTLVAVFAARLLTPPALRLENSWVPWWLSGVMLLEWALLMGLARRWKDGTVPLTMALWCAVLTTLLHLATLRYLDVALYFYAALLGPALVAWWWPGDTGPTAAAVAVTMPALLLLTQFETSANDIKPPLESFVLAALAPLALTPMLLPFLNRQHGWKRWLPCLVLVLIPLVVAIFLAADAEPLNFADPTEPP